MNVQEFIASLDRNPYHPVPPSKYPGLFDFRITRNGLTYLRRLRSEWETAGLSDRKCLYTGLLHLAHAVSIRSPKECKLQEAFMFVTGKKDDVFAPSIRADLMEMGCVEENPEYDPKLYKSHTMWKMKMLGEI